MSKENVINYIRLKYGNITLAEFANKLSIFKTEYLQVRNEWNYNMIIEWRDYIFSLKMSYYSKVKAWEVLNEDMTDDEFYNFVGGATRGRGWSKEKGFDKNKKDKYYFK